MNFIIFTLLVCFYIISVVIIALKLKDIVKDPAKYEEIELENSAYKRMRQKRHCRFFQNLSHQYSFVSFALMLLLTAVSTVVLYGLIKIIAGDHTLILPGTWGIGIIAMFFLNIILGMVIIPLHIKNSFFAVAVDGMFNGSRYDIWKKGYIAFLIFFILTFPFFALSANTYIYYDDNGITSSGYFEITETYTVYEDIEEVRISPHHNKHGQISSLNYEVKLSNGKTLELCVNPFYDARTLEIHKILEARGTCKVDLEPLTDTDIADLTEKLSDEKLEIVKYIFEGFH